MQAINKDKHIPAKLRKNKDLMSYSISLNVSCGMNLMYFKDSIKEEDMTQEQEVMMNALQGCVVMSNTLLTTAYGEKFRDRKEYREVIAKYYDKQVEGSEEE